MGIAVVANHKVNVVSDVSQANRYLVFDYDAADLRQVLEGKNINTADCMRGKEVDKNAFYVPKAQFSNFNYTASTPPTVIKAIGKQLEVAAASQEISH